MSYNEISKMKMQVKKFNDEKKLKSGSISFKERKKI